MTAGTPAYDDPVPDTWVAAIHASEDDYQPLGAAVVIDVDRVLTCAHVVSSHLTVTDNGTAELRQPLWIAFPKAGGCPRRQVASVTGIAYSMPVKDLAVLVLREPVPAGVDAAPLRCPEPEALVGQAWRAFGFPDRDPLGSEAEGVVGTSLADGWVRLDKKSRYKVELGFSGAGVWSRDYQAVVAVVGQAHSKGDGRAVTLHQADQWFPEQSIRALAGWTVKAAETVALEQWGWTLARDREGTRHWRPRARGVSIESERGFRFRGRTAALSRIVEWLDRRQPDRRVLVVTGSPGVGKSAVLGRIVTTADPGIRVALPPDDAAVRASLGSVGCAVHAKAKTALEVAEEIARAASAALPGQPGDLAPAVREALEVCGGRRFNVVIDALDEAASPVEARVVIDLIALPLAETCSDIGVQVVVGTRRRDDGGDLLGRFGAALTVIDLDDPEYFAEQDLAAYALACLQLTGGERSGNPYADDVLAVPLASQIAAMSRRNFLVAGLTARAHGMHDEEPTDPAQLTFPATVGSALTGYISRLGPAGDLPADQALTAVAFAEAPGWPVGLWKLAAEALYGAPVRAEDLARFARSAAASFLVETGGTGQDPSVARQYRLFHQALNDALLHARSEITPRAEDERALVRAFIRHGREQGWQNAPRYLLRSLIAHARAAGLADELLTEDEYLLHADLRRLLQSADHASSERGHRRIRLLQLTPYAITAGPAERAALFSVTEAVENLGTSYRDQDCQTPYRAQWASVGPHAERAILDGHQGPVKALCRVTVGGRELLASGNDDGTVRVWDPETGEQRIVLQAQQGQVRAVSPVTVAGRELLASGGTDGTVRIWDPGTGQQHATLHGHRGGVAAVSPVTVAGRELLASGGTDGTVRIWDPGTGQQHATLHGHRGGVAAVSPVTVAGRELLASGGTDRTVRIWDPGTGQQQAALEGHQGEIAALCRVTIADRDLLASGGGLGHWNPKMGESPHPVWHSDGAVRIWDPETGQQHARLWHGNTVTAICAVTVAGRHLLASSDDGYQGDGYRPVQIWDPQTGEKYAALKGHQGKVQALCPVTVTGRELLASGGDDGTVRIWNPGADLNRAAAESLHDSVSAVCGVTVAGRELLASGGRDGTIRISDPRTGQQHAALEGHQGGVSAICPVTIAGRDLLASGGGGTVRIWDLETGEQRTVLEHSGGVTSLCTFSVAGQHLLASRDGEGNVHIWDLESGLQRTIVKD